MTQRILLYGATGYSGRLIARHAARQWGTRSQPKGAFRLVLAGRSARAMQKVCDEFDLDGVVVGLDSKAAVVDALRGCHAVVNAAGPFALTAERLAKAALDADCHYVDINGEVEVYQRLDDLGYVAQRRGLALVCGAGETAAATDMLLEGALRQLAERELGAVRFAVVRSQDFSRGSARSALRWAREQVPVMRSMHLQHVPIGQLERTFDFGGTLNRRIASAVAMIEPFTALHTLRRLGKTADAIETYMAMTPWARAGYQVGGLTAPWMNLPPWRNLTQGLVELLPEGPTAEARHANRHTVLLQIEDRFRRTLIDWRLETPDPYDFTARSAPAVAAAVASADGKLNGWVTPAEALSRNALHAGRLSDEVFADSILQRREVAA